MQQRMITLCASKRNAPKALGSRDHSVFAIIPSWRYYCGNVLRRIIVVNCHPFDAERSAGRTYLQGCHKSSPSPKDGAPKGLERPGSGHVQGTHFYPKSNFRQEAVSKNPARFLYTVTGWIRSKQEQRSYTHPIRHLFEVL